MGKQEPLSGSFEFGLKTETGYFDQQMAQYTGYSSSHFSMLFKKETGHSPLNYFNLLKIQYACQLLSSTNMKINQISFKVGIDDSFYFSRLFTKLMGMSPKDYRLHIQEK